MVRYLYARKGFTLIELLTATAIMTVVIGGSLAIYIMSLTAWKEGSVQIALQRKASIVMEKMVRGIDGMNGIREADYVTFFNTTNGIQYRSGIDGITRSFYLNSDEIMYDPNIAIGGGSPFSIAKNVSPNGLRFTGSGNIVTINLSMAEQVIDNTITVDLTTLVNLRND